MLDMDAMVMVFMVINVVMLVRLVMDRGRDGTGRKIIRKIRTVLKPSGK